MRLIDIPNRLRDGFDELPRWLREYLQFIAFMVVLVAVVTIITGLLALSVWLVGLWGPIIVIFFVLMPLSFWMDI